MPTIYTTDAMGIYNGSVEIGIYDRIPPHSSMTAPPAGEFVQLQGNEWVVLEAYPVPPTPAPIVPTAVTMRQARLALLWAGLLATVDTTIDSLPSPQKEAARIEWEYSQEVQRHNGFVSVLALMLGMTEEQTDALFIAAAKL